MNTTPRLLRLVGLGLRGRLVVVGVEQTRAAVMRGELVLAIVAADASPNSRDKIVPLLQGRSISMIETASARGLGGAVGREATAVVGVLDEELARGIRAAYEDRETLGE